MKINNQKGFITVDYLFALVLVSGFSFIIFALSLTLTMTETIQYVTFSAARNFYAANQNQNAQTAAAAQKYQELTTDPVLTPLLKSGWFELSAFTVGTNLPENVSDLSKIKDSGLYSRTNSTFHGAVVYFVSKVLEFNIPFYGSTVSDDLRGGTDFGAYIGSYLGREVTQDECENFLIQRWEKIKLLPTSGAAPYSDARSTQNSYLGFADNGC